MVPPRDGVGPAETASDASLAKNGDQTVTTDGSAASRSWWAAGGVARGIGEGAAGSDNTCPAACVCHA